MFVFASSSGHFWVTDFLLFLALLFLLNYFLLNLFLFLRKSGGGEGAKASPSLSLCAVLRDRGTENNCWPLEDMTCTSLTYCMNKEKSVSMWKKKIVKLSQLWRMAWFLTKSGFTMTVCTAPATYSIIGNETCHFKMTSCQCCVSWKAVLVYTHPSLQLRLSTAVQCLANKLLLLLVFSV